MKKNLLFPVILAISSLINAQMIRADKQNNRLGFKGDFSLSYNNALTENNLSVADHTNLKISENNTPTRDFFRKEMMKQGTIKSGTAIGSSARLIGAEILLFDSEVNQTTIDFIKNTQTPFVNLEFEYMITDDIAVGVLGGYTKTDSSNRKSDGVRTNTELNGIILGGNVAMYRPLTSWLYLPLYAEFIYSNGTLSSTNGLLKENYEYQSMRPSIGTGLSLVFSEFIQVDLRGVDISRTTVEFVQTIKTDSSGTVQRIDEKSSTTKLEIASNPRLRILFHVFRVGGGGNSNR